MSKEFIEKRIGASDIAEAQRQQRQLLYFTKSKIQEDVTNTWYERLTTNGYQGKDDFLNWVCMVFKQDNFNTFFKYLRFPIVTAKLVRNKIEPELSRVFYAEDSYFKYSIRGKEVQQPEQLNSDKFKQELFDRILYNHNDILIHDLKDVNKAKRFFVSIDDVVAIDSCDSVIKRIAFTGTIKDDNGNDIDGYIYIDDKEYIFYDRAFKNEPIVEPHDLEETPADYISPLPFDNKDPVRRSIFSDTREALEEYTFLKTLQRMSEPNGMIPVITKLKTKEVGTNESDRVDQDPSSIAMSATKITPTLNKSKAKQVLEAGTQIEVPAVRKEDGSIDMDMVTNFVKFHYLPVEAMEYTNNRIYEIKREIVTATTGDYFEPNENSQNEMQVSKGYISKEDRLRDVSLALTRIMSISDYKFLALENGKDNVEVDEFFGSDFFLETEEDIYNLIKISPNPIESKSNLIRLAKNRGRSNRQRGERDLILYKLLPYSVDSNFDKAVSSNIVDPVTFEYQTRFDYWINSFESLYGDIVTFWQSFEDVSQAQIFMIVNNLIIDIIKSSIDKQKQNRDEKSNINSSPKDI